MILKAEQWAKKNHIKFPKITVDENKKVEELYIFDDDKDLDCPTVMHFVLVNKDFWKYRKPGLYLPKVILHNSQISDFHKFKVLQATELYRYSPFFRQCPPKAFVCSIDLISGVTHYYIGLYNISSSQIFHVSSSYM